MEQAKLLFNEVKRFTLPKSLWFVQQALNAGQVLTRYLAEPSVFWWDSQARQVAKVQHCVQALMHSGVESPDAVVELLLDRVRELRSTHNHPFFVMSPPASGSTWLGAMLGDLPGYCYGGEIYLPTGIGYLYRKFKDQVAQRQEMITLVWSVMLLHAWGLNFPDKTFAHEFVNSGRSIFHYDIYSNVWPEGHFIFLMRDPRDQLLALTYRKKTRRQRLNFKGSDLKFMRHNAKFVMKIYKNYIFYNKANTRNIYTVRYEDLKEDTAYELRKIIDRFQLNIREDALARIVYEHDAQNMRNGLVPHRGNLDEGGIARDWREVLTENEKRLLKPIIQEALEAFGYEKNAAW